MSSPFVYLSTTDRICFAVDHRLVLLSGKLRDGLHARNLRVPIAVPIHSSVLGKVLNWARMFEAKLRAAGLGPEDVAVLNEQLTWIDVLALDCATLPMLYAANWAANYLDIKRLMKVTYKLIQVAHHRNTADQVRAMWHDLTPQQRRDLRPMYQPCQLLIN